MTRSKIVSIFVLLLCISAALIAAATFVMDQQYSFERQERLLSEYNQFLEENGFVGLNNLTRMINSGLIVSFNRPVENDGLVRSNSNNFFLI
ncbi:MAG: hypothetical protein LBV40_00255 [Methanomicrobiales archaeon]|nr:hypothetical protein [Methanomicrobiales archaeon]